MLEKYGRFMAAVDSTVIFALLVLAVKVSFIFIGALAFYTVLVVFKIYAASAALEEERVSAALARNAQFKDTFTLGTQSSQSYSGGYVPSQSASPVPPVTNNSSDFVMGMALGNIDDSL